jgi:putative membrane protein
MLKMASGVIPGFNVQGFWTAIFGSMIISLISWLLNSFISDQGSVSYINAQRHDQERRIDGVAGEDDTIDLKKKDNNRWE